MGAQSKSSEKILTVNIGSSSIKLVLFTGLPLEPSVQASITNIGQPQAAITITGAGQPRQFSKVTNGNHRQAITTIFDKTQQLVRLDELTAIGHRLPTGGPTFSKPVVITTENLKDLHDLARFDPFLTPITLELIEALRKRLPQTPQVACFDTEFFGNLPAVAQVLPLPHTIASHGVRRYGSQGLAYASITEQFEVMVGEPAAKGRVIMAQLGSSASLTAIKNGKVVDTTATLTPASGLLGATHSGDVDPGLATILNRLAGVSAEQFDHMANHESGLTGVSGLSPNMELLINESGRNPRARQAVELFCYQVRKAIGALTAAMGGVDSLIFSGGIGENSWVIRSSVCDGLEYLGVHLDEKRNKNCEFLLSSPESTVGVHLIKSDEAGILARHTTALIKPQA